MSAVVRAEAAAERVWSDAGRDGSGADVVCDGRAKRGILQLGPDKGRVLEQSAEAFTVGAERQREEGEECFDERCGRDGQSAAEEAGDAEAGENVGHGIGVVGQVADHEGNVVGGDALHIDFPTDAACEILDLAIEADGSRERNAVGAAEGEGCIFHLHGIAKVLGPAAPGILGAHHHLAADA